MVEITAALVKKLRDATNVSMMECKRALQDAEGDLDKAAVLLRERGMATAAKKSTRTANQGLVASAVAPDRRSASLVEVNCETDFVARNTNFQEFVESLARRALETDENLPETCKEEVVAKVAEIGENIVIARNSRLVLEGNGRIESYIHLGGKVGVLLDLGCEKAETEQSPVFAEVARDLVLHVAACAPKYLTSDEVPEDEVAAEREIYAKQVQDKPANIIDKIVDGKIRKYFAEVCLLDQGFVKEPKQAVKALLAEKGKEVDDTLTIRRFALYQLGRP